MATLVNPLSFQLDTTGVILNDDLISPGTPFVDITAVKGLSSAPFRDTRRDHEGVDGGFIDAEFETGREITLEGTIYDNGADLESYLDSLKENYAPSTTPKPFYFITESGQQRLIYVKPLGCEYDWELARRYGSVIASFKMYAEDPRIYDTNLQTVPFTMGATVTTGFGFNMTFNLSFGGVSATPDGQYVTNAGNRPTPAIFTINGPVTMPVIVNDTVGVNLTFDITLGVGEYLTVDTANHTVRLNGTANRRNTLLVPNWFLLSKGQSFIRFRGASGSGNMVLQFRNAWR